MPLSRNGFLKFLLNFMRKELVKKRCCAALNAIMDYRNITKAQLAKETGISYRSIEKYCNGENDISCSKAYNVIEIEHYLDVDGRILTGSRSIDDFYNAESERLDREEERIKENAKKKQGDVYISAMPDDNVPGITSAFKIHYISPEDGEEMDENQRQRKLLERLLIFYQNYLDAMSKNDEQ